MSGAFPVPKFLSIEIRRPSNPSSVITSTVEERAKEDRQKTEHERADREVREAIATVEAMKRERERERKDSTEQQKRVADDVPESDRDIKRAAVEQVEVASATTPSSQAPSTTAAPAPPPAIATATTAAAAPTATSAETVLARFAEARKCVTPARRTGSPLRQDRRPRTRCKQARVRRNVVNRQQYKRPTKETNQSAQTGRQPT